MSQQEQIKADLKAAISELTAKNAEALGTQEENQKSITNLQNRVSELTRDLHIRAKEIEGERSRAEKLAIALQDANERAKKYETGFTRAQFLEEEIKSKEIVIEDLRSRSDDVRRGAASKDDEMSELRAAVNKHVHTIKMLEGEISGLNFAAKSKDEALQKMHQSKLAVQSELSDARSRAVSDITVSASEVEKLRGECSRLKLQLQNAHQMIRDLEVQTDRQGGDDTQSLQRALAESKDEIRRRDLEVETFKTSAQDLRTRLLAVSEENRSLIERMRGGGNGSSKEQEAHVAQLRQQLVSAAEINQVSTLSHQQLLHLSPILLPIPIVLASRQSTSSFETQHFSALVCSAVKKTHLSRLTRSSAGSIAEECGDEGAAEGDEGAYCETFEQ